MKAAVLARSESAAGDRRGGHGRPGAEGSTRAYRCGGRMPLRPALSERLLPLPAAGRSRPTSPPVWSRRLDPTCTTSSRAITSSPCLSAFCGHCEACLTGRMVLCNEPELSRDAGEPPRLASGDETINQFLNLSSFAEEMLIHEHALAKIRDDMPLDRAALIGCGVTTGVGAVIHTADIEPGSTVCRDRLRRGRPVVHQRRRYRRGRAHHRHRHRRLQARTRSHIRRHRRRQRSRGGSHRHGPGNDRRWRALLLRGDRPQGNHRTSLKMIRNGGTRPRSSA